MGWFEIGRGRCVRGAQKAKKAHLLVSLFDGTRSRKFS